MAENDMTEREIQQMEARTQETERQLQAKLDEQDELSEWIEISAEGALHMAKLLRSQGHPEEVINAWIPDLKELEKENLRIKRDAVTEGYLHVYLRGEGDEATVEATFLRKTALGE